jgi:hypothetical protein
MNGILLHSRVQETTRQYNGDAVARPLTETSVATPQWMAGCLREEALRAYAKCSSSANWRNKTSPEMLRGSKGSMCENLKSAGLREVAAKGTPEREPWRLLLCP